MFDKVIEATCETFGVAKEELLAKTRLRKQVADARMMAMVLLHTLADGALTRKQVAAMFGGRDRKCINNAYRFCGTEAVAAEMQPLLTRLRGMIATETETNARESIYAEEQLDAARTE